MRAPPLNSMEGSLLASSVGAQHRSNPGRSRRGHCPGAIDKWTL